MAATVDKVRFDGWTLTKSTGELAKGGVVTRLQLQPLQVLAELVEHPGELVTREQLIARLWPKGIVDFDTSLNTAVRKLRVALNDDPERPRYIETIPRRGYRFLATLDPGASAAVVSAEQPVTEAPLAIVQAPVKSSGRRRRYAIGAIVIAALVLFAVNSWWLPGRHVKPALVVLPFVDMTSEQKDAALCEGITEELSGRLSQLRSVNVVARTSAYEYQGKNQDVRVIGKSLGVTHAIEGSVRRDDGVLRVTVQLVSTDDGQHYYSESFDFVTSNVLDIQQTLAQAITQELRVWFSPDMIERWQDRNSPSREAFEFYVRARRYGHKRTADASDQAAALYRMAIDRDPKFALAYVGLAEVQLSTISGREVPVGEVAESVRKLLEQAERLSPDLAEVESTRGWLALESNALQDAITHLNTAIARNPNDAVTHSRLGIVYGLLAQPRDALEQQTRAAELDPHDFIPPMYRCIQLQELGQFDEAARACARTRELAPENVWGLFVTSWLEDGRGDIPEAIRWTREASKLEPSNASIVLYRIDLLLMLHLVAPARAAASDLGTTDEARERLIQASLALAERGRDGLKAYLSREGTEALDVPATRYEAMRLYHTAGEITRLRTAIQKVFDSPEFTEAGLYDAEQVRNGFSPAIILAGALFATGETKRAARILDGLDEMLDRLEKNGWANYGIDSLRAESLALRGQGDAAMRALQRAVDRGWRSSWRAKEEPYLDSLRNRNDFQALLKDVEARNALMRAHISLTPTSGAGSRRLR